MNLHFNDNPEQILGDSLYKVQPIVDELKKNFSCFLNPYKNLYIDETLTLCKSRLYFKQYIPSEHHKFEIKMSILHDCKTNFIIDFVIFARSETEFNYQEHIGVTGSIVTTLLHRFLNKDHSLFVDNSCSIPLYFEYLHQ